MIERILEPEVMESQEEAIAYDDMDHQSVNDQFVADLLATQAVSGEALDIGTGTARIPLILCKQNPDIRVIAVDLSESMLDLARLNIEIASLSDRIQLDRLDAKAISLEDDRFDLVMSNSIIHHVPDPDIVFRESARVCKPGGFLFFRDLLRPESEEQLKELSETYTRDEPDNARKMFEDSLRAALTIEEVRHSIVQLGFAEESVQATSDRHWTWAATRI